MPTGYKTGGRKKGTPNKRTELFLDCLGDYNPLEALLRLVKDTKTPIDTKVKINLDLLPYMYPKRKQVDLQTSADIIIPIIKDDIPEV
jgi:hypothetical protein